MLTQQRLKQLLDYDPITGVFTWKAKTGRRSAGAVAGNPHCRGYWSIGIDRKNYLAHRLAWLWVYGKFPDGDLDHEDTVRTHNAISNLRPATTTQNNGNAKLCRRNRSGFKGVRWHKHSQKWTAQIGINGKCRHLGVFNTPQAAHAAYMAEAKKYFGKFARAA